MKLKTFLLPFKIIIVVSFLSSLFACSGNDSKSTKADKTPTLKNKEATTTTTDACSLITEEEAKAILETVKNGIHTANMCQYISGSEELSKAGESVSIQLYPGTASEFDNYVSSTERNLNVKTKPVSGIGDKAVFAEGQLIVSKGNDFMIVIVGKKMPEAEQITAEKNIAQKAIDRLTTH